MRFRTIVGLVVVGALVLGACGNGDTEGSTPPADGGESPAAGEDGGGAATVATAESELGEHLVGADGATLYLFLPDEAGGSTCIDECATTWPPLTIEGSPVAGDGADGSLLGTIERDDGSTQVTYGGWPVYTYAADAAPGDVNGQGVGEVWFVVDPAGEPIDGTQAAAGGTGGGAGAKY